MTITNALPSDTDPGLAPNFPGQGIDGATRKYSASDIASLAGGVNASVGLLQNQNVIAANLTIPAGFNAALVGPITVAQGTTITVPQGAILKVL